MMVGTAYPCPLGSSPFPSLKLEEKAVLLFIISLLPKSPAHPHCSLVTWENTNACGFQTARKSQ